MIWILCPSSIEPTREPTSALKGLKPAQIAKEKKSIVKDIKKLITPMKADVQNDSLVLPSGDDLDFMPVFMYWQYYKEHHAICPQLPRDGQDFYAFVSSGAHLDTKLAI